MNMMKGMFILLLLLNWNLFAQGVTANASVSVGTGGAADPAAAGAQTTLGEVPTIAGELIPEPDDPMDDKSLNDGDKKRLKDNLLQEKMWKNPDYSGYYRAFEELYKLSKAFSNNKYRLALSNYQSGMNTILKMREQIDQFRKEESEKKRLDERWYWQKIDRKAKEERVVAREKMAAKLAAVTFFTKAINHMDEINNPDLRERQEYKTLMSSIYRAWIMSEYDTQNFSQCIPILELYLEIDENEKEYPAHKYLASCYAFEENVLKRFNKNAEDQILKFKYKKNVHLLRATELKYGKGSIEYKHIVDLVNKDEVVSVTP